MVESEIKVGVRAEGDKPKEEEPSPRPTEEVTQTDQYAALRKIIDDFLGVSEEDEQSEEKRRGLNRAAGIEISKLIGSSEGEETTLASLDEKIAGLKGKKNKEKKSELKKARDGIVKAVAEVVSASTTEGAKGIRDGVVAAVLTSEKTEADKLRQAVVKELPTAVRSSEVVPAVEEAVEAKIQISREKFGGLVEAAERDIGLVTAVTGLEQEVIAARQEMRVAVTEFGKKLGLPDSILEEVTRKIEAALNNSRDPRDKEKLIKEARSLCLVGVGSLETDSEVEQIAREKLNKLPGGMKDSAFRLGKLVELKKTLSSAARKFGLRRVANLIDAEIDRLEDEFVRAIAQVDSLQKESEKQKKERERSQKKLEDDLGSEAGKFDSWRAVQHRYVYLRQCELEAEREFETEKLRLPKDKEPAKRFKDKIDRAREQRVKFESSVYNQWEEVAKERLAGELARIDEVIDQSPVEKYAQAVDEARGRDGVGDFDAARTAADQLSIILQNLSLPENLQLLDENEVFKGFFEHYLSEKMATYYDKVAGTFSPEIPDDEDEQLAEIEKRWALMMRMGPTPDILVRSPLYMQTEYWLSNRKISTKVLDLWRAKTGSMRFGSAVYGSFDTVFSAASDLSNKEIVWLLKREKFALAYDILEDSAQEFLKNKKDKDEKTIATATTPDQRTTVDKQLAREWIVRTIGLHRLARLTPEELALVRLGAMKTLGDRGKGDLVDNNVFVDKEIVRILGEREMAEIGRDELDDLEEEAYAFLSEAEPLWKHTSLARTYSNNKDNFGIARLQGEQYYRRLDDSKIGEPGLVSLTAGRSYKRIGQNEEANKLGMAVPFYYEYLALDALKQLKLDDPGDLEKKTEFSFVMEGGKRKTEQVTLAGRPVVCFDAKGERVNGAYILRREDGMELLVATKFETDKDGKAKEKPTAVLEVRNPTAAGLTDLHKYAKNADFKNYIQSVLNNAEKGRKALEDSGFFGPNPIGGNLGTFGLKSEVMAAVQNLYSNVFLHLDELATIEKAFYQKSENEGKVWQRDPGVFYKEDAFREYCDGLMEYAGSKEGRSRYEAYALAPWNRRAVILTAFARAGLITPEMEEELERKYFGHRMFRTLMAQADLYLAVWRIRSVRTMLILGAVGNFFKTLFGYAFESSPKR